MTQIFIFTKDDKLLGDFYWDNTIALASALEKWALKEGVQIPLFSYAIGGDDERWTITQTEPLKIVAGEANEVEAEADVVVNTSRQNEILLKILVAQEKQLYWIRIIGIPFLFAAIGTFLALIIRVFN